MGCILGVCAAQAACCCASSACHLCCACCPSSVSSVMTRLMYLFVIIVGILLSSVFLIPSVRESLEKRPEDIPFLKDKTYCQHVGLDCSSWLGFESVYRVWFAFTMFFVLMALLTIGVKSSNDCRSKLQNGFWFFKFLIIAGIMVGAFYLPMDPFNKVWMYIGLVGGILFIFIQVVYLIDVAHSWTENWQDNAEENNFYKFAFVFVCLIFYGLSIAGVVSMYIYFTQADGCDLNKGLITFNLILCVIVSFVSILPGIQDANRRSGLLQASLVTLYVTYLTFSALSNVPESSCPKNFSTIPGGGNTMLVVGIVIAVMTIFVVSLKSSADGMGGGTSVVDEEAPVQKVSDDEEDEVQYNYGLFHVLCVLACLYLMMVMTNWLKPDTVNSGGFTFEANWPSVWVQIVSSWLCIALYVWTLIAPIACPSRQFGFAGGDE